MLKRYLYILLFALISVNGSAQTMAVNKFHHSPLILDSFARYVASSTVTSVVIAAYSVRRINLYYSGPLMQIRNSSGGGTLDIYYTASNYLDTNAIKTFIGSNNATVSIWYDQSGNGKNAIQTTASNQPTIVNAGKIYRQNGIPSVYFNSDWLTYTNSSVPGNVAHSMNCVARADDGTGNFIAYGSNTSGNENSCLGSGNNSVSGCVGAIWIGGYNQDGGYQGGSAIAALAVRTKTYTPTPSVSNIGYVNRSSVITTTTAFNLTNATLKIGVQDDASDDPLTGYISESIIFPLTLTTGGRGGLENNQKAYYGTP